MKKRIRINGIIIFLAFLLIAIFPNFFIRQKNLASLDTIIEACGIAFILLGQLIRVSARGYKADHSQSGKALIQDGPYGFSRNPMYLGILVIGAGVVFMLFKWWSIIVFLIFFVIRYILLIFSEEKKLKLVFPLEYPLYQQKTPRIVPSLKRIIKTDISEYLPLKLSWIKKEIVPILIVLLAVLFVESFEDIRTKGIGIYLKESVVYFIVIVLFIWIAIYLSKRSSSYETNKS